MKITNIHPALTALETAMAKLVTAQEQMRGFDNWLERTNSSVDTTNWTKKMEKALGKPEEQEAVRVTYDETALGAMSTWLSHQSHRRHLIACEQEVLAALREVIAAYDAIDSKSPNNWLKPILQTRCIEAVELRDASRHEPAVDDHGATFKRVFNILVTTFTAFAADLTKYGPRRSYTTDLVVPGHKYESFLDKSVDLRNVRMVEFVDCVNSKHPASQRLSDLFSQLQPLIDAARLAESRLKGGQNPYDKNCSKINNGTINERQHANRLMDALHGQPYGCGPSTDQVEEQNQRRRLYEGVRQEVLIAKSQLQALYEELCEALHAAVVETQQFLTEVLNDYRSTIDRLDTVRICLNNCLAIDSRLRSLGRELKNLDSVYGKDFSRGAGREATSEKFAEIERIYRLSPRLSVTDSEAQA